MKENTEEESLVAISENSIFYRIKQFFKNLFNRKESVVIATPSEATNIITQDEDKRNRFMAEIKKIEDDETKLLKLQKQYRSGEITEEELTEKQINDLCSLYDIQIAKLKKSNEMRKQRLLEYRKKLQTDN